MDWGDAPDDVDAMHRIVRLPAADDFVVASAGKHWVLDFVKLAFGDLGVGPEAVWGPGSQLGGEKEAHSCRKCRHLQSVSGGKARRGSDQRVKWLPVEGGAVPNES